MEDFFTSLSKQSPVEFTSFYNLMQSIEKTQILDQKTKELINIALSVKSQCAFCIDFHVKVALEKGINKQEIISACWQAVLMGGGPSFMYIQEVLKAIEKYE